MIKSTTDLTLMKQILLLHTVFSLRGRRARIAARECEVGSGTISTVLKQTGKRHG